MARIYNNTYIRAAMRTHHTSRQAQQHHRHLHLRSTALLSLQRLPLLLLVLRLLLSVSVVLLLLRLMLLLAFHRLLRHRLSSSFAAFHRGTAVAALPFVILMSWIVLRSIARPSCSS